jgi:hypothetical protein
MSIQRFGTADIDGLWLLRRTHAVISTYLAVIPVSLQFRVLILRCIKGYIARVQFIIMPTKIHVVLQDPS